MRIITPERVALSAITYGAGTDEIDILDFDFGADEGLIINAVEGLLSTAGTFADVQVAIAQELNLDSDIAAGEHWAKTDRTVIDSPIVFWHRMDVTTGIDDGAGGGVVAVSSGHKEIDFRLLSPEMRPKTIDNPVHVVDAGATATGSSLILVRYQLVQFSLSELGILNAFRRF